MADLLKKAMKSVSEYNKQLNQERKEDRRVCMDLQTYTVHYPVGLGKDNKSLRRRRGPIGRYPVALFGTQYQDWYMKYTPQELKYFPLNTVIYGPISDANKLPPLLQSSNASNSDSDAETNGSDDESSCSCDRTAHEDIADNEESSESGDCSPPQLVRQTKLKPNAICKVCKGNADKNKENKAEELLHCSDCDNSGHPSCLEFNDEMIDAIRLYQWQCMDCKTCVHCGQPHDEDKMMFCDKCDRGYHTFCVGLKSIPHGRWVCLLCANCGQCGAKIPSPVNQKGSQWQHEVIKILSPNGDTMTRHQVLCHACYRLRKQR